MLWEKMEQLVGFSLLMINLHYHLMESMLIAMILIHHYLLYLLEQNRLPAPSKKISGTSSCFGRDLSYSFGVESSKSLKFLKYFHSKAKSAFYGSKNRDWA